MVELQRKRLKLSTKQCRSNGSCHGIMLAIWGVGGPGAEEIGEESRRGLSGAGVHLELESASGVKRVVIPRRSSNPSNSNGHDRKLSRRTTAF